jgi:hypothetical protein
MLAGQSVQQAMQWPGSSTASRYMASPFPGMSLSQQATTGARITPVAGVSTPQFMGAPQVCVHAWTRAWLYSCAFCVRASMRAGKSLTMDLV